MLEFKDQDFKLRLPKDNIDHDIFCEARPEEEIRLVAGGHLIDALDLDLPSTVKSISVKLLHVISPRSNYGNFVETSATRM
jgi:hypothetical protein